MEKVPFLSLTFQHNQIKAAVLEGITKVYDQNWFVLGQELEHFESAFANYCGTPFCAGVGNGLDALTLSLLACRVGPGDEVIVPAHTYIATWLAVSRTGASIVPVEPDIATMNMDPERIERAITTKTKAILPVHLYGQPCDMTAIDLLARRHKLLVIEDNAQSQGAHWLEKKTGSFGDINATSFYPTKNLGALGDGGAITTYDEQKLFEVRRLRNYGYHEKNFGAIKGFNSRLDEVQAKVLSIKLEHLDQWNVIRRAIADEYLTALTGIGDLLLPRAHKEAYHVYHQFVVRTAYRDALRAHLSAQNIETLIHYPLPPHLQESYRELGFKQGSFPITERIAETALSLPIWPGMSAGQTDFVIKSIKDFFLDK